MPRDRRPFTARRKDLHGPQPGMKVHVTGKGQNKGVGVLVNRLPGGRCDVLLRPGKKTENMLRNIDIERVTTDLAVRRGYEESWRRNGGAPPLEETVDPGERWRDEELDVVLDHMAGNITLEEAHQRLRRSKTSILSKEWSLRYLEG